MADVKDNTLAAQPWSGPVGVPTDGTGLSAARTPEPTAPAGRRYTELLSSYGIFAVAALVVAVSAATINNFATSHNIYTILSSASLVGLVAVGMTFVVISGNFIDLSVVAQVGLAGTVFINLAPRGLPLAIAAGVASCLIFGVANATLIGVFGANAIIVTLGTEVTGLGVVDNLTKGTEYSGTSSAVGHFGVSSWGPVPVIFVVFLAVAALGYLLLDRTSIGFTFRSAGANRKAARVSGVPVSRRIALAFIVVSVCAAGAGFLQAAFTNTAVASNGAGFDFNSLAAVAVGGTSLFGGRGGVGRTVVGVLFIAVVQNILILVGLSFAAQELVEGLIIVGAVGLDGLSRKAMAR